jgi:hypothetical protein
VGFSESVAGLDLADFDLTTTGTTVTTVTLVAGGPTTYTVTVNTGSGDGMIRLDLLDDDSILDGAGNPLGGAGASNGDYRAGPAYTIDKTPPTVSMTTTLLDPTLQSVIPVTVSFTEPIEGFTAEDVTAGNAALSDFSGAGAAYSFVLTALDEGLVTATISVGAAFDAASNPCASAAFSRQVVPLGGVVWVQFDCAGAHLGTENDPLPSLADGLEALNSGGILRIKEGQTGDTRRIDRHARIEAPAGSVRIGVPMP